MKAIRYISTILVSAGLMLISCSDNADIPELPIPEDMVQVRGNLIDIRSFVPGEEAYPQNNGFGLPSEAGELFGADCKFAVSLREYRGPEAVRSGKDGSITIGLPTDEATVDGWNITDRSVVIGAGVKAVTYNFYTHECRANEWLEIPEAGEVSVSSIVIGQNLTVEVPEIKGTVIAKSPSLRKMNINNPAITILPSGHYAASCTGISKDGATLFISKDKGRTWETVHENVTAVNGGIRNYIALFVHQGKFYMMGCKTDKVSFGHDILIACSEDEGQTWKSATVFEGKYYASINPVIRANGRIWRAMETRVLNTDGSESSKGCHPTIISAPEDSDLMDPASWTKADNLKIENSLTYGEEVIDRMQEGCIVEGPDGVMYDIIRCDGPANIAGVFKVNSPTTVTFNSANGFIGFPGGDKKFEIRFDAQSGKYWTLSNLSKGGEGPSHSGIYADGMAPGLVRNKLTLSYSTDLKIWIPYRNIIVSEDAFFHGYQYVNWAFDGNDIIAVVRQACQEERGLPTRQHDANMFTFYRIKDFRN